MTSSLSPPASRQQALTLREDPGALKVSTPAHVPQQVKAELPPNPSGRSFAISYPFQEQNLHPSFFYHFLPPLAAAQEAHQLCYSLLIDRCRRAESQVSSLVAENDSLSQENRGLKEQKDGVAYTALIYEQENRLLREQIKSLKKMFSKEQSNMEDVLSLATSRETSDRTALEREHEKNERLAEELQATKKQTHNLIRQTAGLLPGPAAAPKRPAPSMEPSQEAKKTKPTPLPEIHSTP